MIKNKLLKNRKKGFSLIELLLVLGVIAALAIVAFIVFTKVNDDMIVSRESGKIIETAAIIANISDNPQLKGEYSSYVSPEQVSAFLSPEEKADMEATGYFHTKGQVGITAYYTSNSEGEAYDSVIFNVRDSVLTESQCIKLLNRLRVYNPPVFNLGGGSANLDVNTIPELCEDDNPDAGYIAFGVSKSTAGG